jgi:hypothetical protein
VAKTERDVAQVSFEEGTAAFAETMRANVPNGDTPLRRVKVDYVRVVDLDIGASKSGICAVRVVTILERAGRTRACNRGLV